MNNREKIANWAAHGCRLAHEESMSMQEMIDFFRMSYHLSELMGVAWGKEHTQTAAEIHGSPADWHTIETPPIDGQTVWATDGDGLALVTRGENCWLQEFVVAPCEWAFTHWKALPVLPGEEK